MFNLSKHLYEYEDFDQDIENVALISKWSEKNSCYCPYFPVGYGFNDFYEQKAPPYTIKETENAQTLSIELPGVSKKDITVTLENNQLKVEWSRNGKKFSHFFTDIGAGNITASYKNGILTIILPTKKHNIKEIEVK